MTAEQRADILMEQLPYRKKTEGGVEGFRKALVLAIKEAMRAAPLPAVPDVDIANLIAEAREVARTIRITEPIIARGMIGRLTCVLEREHTARNVAERRLTAMRNLMNFCLVDGRRQTLCLECTQGLLALSTPQPPTQESRADG